MDSMVDAPAAKPAEESMQDPPPDVLDAKDEAALLRRVSELLADGTPAPTARVATPRRYAQFDLEQDSESADRRTARCCGRCSACRIVVWAAVLVGAAIVGAIAFDGDHVLYYL